MKLLDIPPKYKATNLFSVFRFSSDSHDKNDTISYSHVGGKLFNSYMYSLLASFFKQ